MGLETATIDDVNKRNESKGPSPIDPDSGGDKDSIDNFPLTSNGGDEFARFVLYRAALSEEVTESQFVPHRQAVDRLTGRTALRNFLPNFDPYHPDASGANRFSAHTYN